MNLERAPNSGPWDRRDDLTFMQLLEEDLDDAFPGLMVKANKIPTGQLPKAFVRYDGRVGDNTVAGIVLIVNLDERGNPYSDIEQNVDVVYNTLVNDFRYALPLGVTGIYDYPIGQRRGFGAVIHVREP